MTIDGFIILKLNSNTFCAFSKSILGIILLYDITFSDLLQEDHGRRSARLIIIATSIASLVDLSLNDPRE